MKRERRELGENLDWLVQEGGQKREIRTSLPQQMQVNNTG